MKKVNVLGTEYKIITDDSIASLNIDGSCRTYDKEIIIRSYDNMLENGDSDKVKKLRHKEVLRHELIHAFFDESGLSDYSKNEQIVDWIAVQFPKIMKAFEKADCL